MTQGRNSSGLDITPEAMCGQASTCNQIIDPSSVPCTEMNQAHSCGLLIL